jgi:hypothetical protein
MIFPIDYRIFRRINSNEAIIYLYYFSEISEKNEEIYKTKLKNIDENKYSKLDDLLRGLIRINKDKDIPLKFGILEMQYFIEGFE